MLQIEILEIGNNIAPVGVDAGHADHRAREAPSRLVGHVGGIESPARCLRNQLLQPVTARRTAKSRGASGARITTSSIESRATRCRSSSSLVPSLDQHDAQRVRCREVFGSSTDAGRTKFSLS